MAIVQREGWWHRTSGTGQPGGSCDHGNGHLLGGDKLMLKMPSKSECLYMYTYSPKISLSNFFSYCFPLTKPNKKSVTEGSQETDAMD